MTYTLTLMSGYVAGRTFSVNFLSQNFALEDEGLRMSPLGKRQLWGGENSYFPGSRLLASTWENREIEIQFRVSGSTVDILASNLDYIEKILIRARSRSIRGYGDRVALKYQRDSASNPVYYEVYDGHIEYPEDIMSIGQAYLQDPTLGGYALWGVMLKLTCSPFAYSVDFTVQRPQGTSIALSTISETDITTGVTIYNHSDRSGSGYYPYNNVVWVGDTAINGEEAALTQIEFKALSPEDSNPIMTVHIGAEEDEAKTTPVWTYYDSSDGYAYHSGYSTASDTNCSMDNYVSIPFTETTDALLVSWQVIGYNRRETKLRIFGRCRPSYYWDQNAMFCIKITNSSGSTVYYQSDWKKAPTATTGLLDFGTIPLPPWNYGFDVLSDNILLIGIYGKRLSAGTTTLYLDHLQPLPVTGGYRVLKSISGITHTVGVKDTIIDDGMADSVYINNGSDGTTFTGDAYGLLQPILLKPFTKYGLYFLWEITSQTVAVVNQGALIKVRKIEKHGLLV